MWKRDGPIAATPCACAFLSFFSPPTQPSPPFRLPARRRPGARPGTHTASSPPSSSSSLPASRVARTVGAKGRADGEAPPPEAADDAIPPLSMPNDPPGLPPFASAAAAAAAAAWAAEAGTGTDDTEASGFLTAQKGNARTKPAFNKYRSLSNIKREYYSSWVALMAAEVRGAWRTAVVAAAGRGGAAAVALAAGIDPSEVTEAGPTFRIPVSIIESARPSRAAMARYWAAWAWNVATPEPVRYVCVRVWRVLGPRVWAARVAVLGAGARLDAWCARVGGSGRGSAAPSVPDLAHALRRWHGKVGLVEDIRFRWGLLRGKRAAAAA